MLKNLIIKNRSTRRFKQDQPIKLETLRELVDLARLSPSGGNLQPLKYIIANKSAINDKIFPHLAWAGYLSDWQGPESGSQPSAYIIILNDTKISKTSGCDHGIAAQSIMLGASEKGISGCMIGSVHRDKLKQALAIAPQYDIALVLALGIADEQVILEETSSPENIKYYRDENQVHHTPKRPLNEIIL